MIAIKNAVVPPSCYYCPMTNEGLYLCKANNPYKTLEDDCEERRPDWCPLVNIQPHGRLIDADALIKRMWEETDCMISVPATFVRDAPTVIEAEEQSGNSGELED